MKRLLLFGASGSIGGSTLDILRDRPTDFCLAGLSVHANTTDLAGMIAEFRPGRVAISQSSARRAWLAEHPEHAALLIDEDAPLTALLEEPADIALNGVMGFAGLALTLAALERNLDLALANKESLVCGGELLQRRRRESRGRLLPVDSEHSALFQLMADRPAQEVRKVWLTASGGPFRELPASEMAAVTPERALSHPTWSMGPKITVDSATLMNKGLEIIEAALLFDLPAARVDALIHPSSTVHALVELADSSVLCQMAAPDMKQPILHALAHPERPEADYGRLDFSTSLDLSFAPVDHERFPAVNLARNALAAGGSAPLALNAADEIAVAAFLAGRLPFTGIAAVVEEVLAAEVWEPCDGFDALVEADRLARRLAAERIAILATHS
jgi:1-deoxy-D-xylulose-5-phosphate reductoisomerase